MHEPSPRRRSQRADGSRRRRGPAQGARRQSGGVDGADLKGRGAGRARRGTGTEASGPPAEAAPPAEVALPAEVAPLVGEDTAALDLLANGTLTVEGRLVDASNATLYCAIELNGATAACVYKPIAGERPLWDFPPGTLAAREVAAYAVSAAAGWHLVPPTVLREGPFGPGMCQLWIDIDGGADRLALARSCDHGQLRDMAVFDAVINNADRKVGHLLPVSSGRLYGCDHGVTFAEEYKLRTVLWQWRGQRLPERAMEALARVREQLDSGPLGAELASLLSSSELRAARERVDVLIHHQVHPFPPENWPAVPWPPV